jgi:hypothetical protein
VLVRTSVSHNCTQAPGRTCTVQHLSALGSPSNSLLSLRGSCAGEASMSYTYLHVTEGDRHCQCNIALAEVPLWSCRFTHRTFSRTTLLYSPCGTRREHRSNSTPLPHRLRYFLYKYPSSQILSRSHHLTPS